ncbi:sigma 54-interacting transcriptional regulator, partial [Bacillus altitudinis]|uniref:sigma 54-interacting transcriptional regulator n=1 Tax=Bacillus altitudinis TaxID=293387 RepID=UPI003B51CEBD
MTHNSPPLPHNLIQTLLFRTQKPPFTPPTHHPRLFQQPQPPTLLLHHINSLHPPLQPKLFPLFHHNPITTLPTTKQIPIHLTVIPNMN